MINTDSQCLPYRILLPTRLLQLHNHRELWDCVDIRLHGLLALQLDVAVFNDVQLYVGHHLGSGADPSFFVTAIDGALLEKLS